MKLSVPFPLAVGLCIVFVLTGIAILAPWISPQDPEIMTLSRAFESSTLSHPLGLDENGSDILAKIFYGARISLSVAWSVILMSASIGLIIGSVAGYFGGFVGQILMRFVDVVHAFPSFLLALALVAMMGPSVSNLILALCLTSWTAFARLVRGEILHLKEREHVLSARALGCSHLRILTFHIWPGLLGLTIVQCTFSMAGTIIAESGLSFLGLGVPVTTPTWGSLLNSGRQVMSDAPMMSFSAGLAIMTAVLGFNALGAGLRSLLDPRRGHNTSSTRV